MYSAIALLLMAAASDDAADRAGAADTIIVTGERMARDAQDTRSSVAVTTADDLRNQAEPADIDDLLALIPNVQLGAGDQGPAIRGQDSTGILQGANAFLGGSRPRVTLQVDGRALGYNEFIYGLSSVWDVARVEVFRGPQTTSQGRNAIAGAIFIETAAPTFAWEGRARVLVGNQRTRQFSAAVSGPLIDDQLAFRVSGDLRRSRSWVNYDTVTVVGADIRRDDYGLARFKLLAQPSAIPGLRIDITYSHLETANPQGEAIDAPFENRFRALGNGGYFETNVDSLTGRLNYDIGGGFKLSATAAYGDTRIERFAPPRGGQLVLNQKDLSLEAVVSYARNGWEAIGGVYLLDQDTNDTSDLSAFLGLGAFSDEQHSFGVFGEVTVPLGERFAVTGGLRYQRDRQDRLGALGPFMVDYDRTFDAWLPSAALTFKPGDDVTLGISARRGFNPGGTTISFTTGARDNFEDEALWNYELFARSRLSDAVRLNVTAFYTDFFDAQRTLTTVVTLPGGGTALQSQVDNAPRAHSYGAEAELSWSPSRRLSIDAGIGLLHTRIDEALVATDPIIGKRFSRAPRFTGALGIAWQPVDRLRISGQLRHNSRYFSDDRNTPTFAIAGSTTADAKLAYTVGPATIAAYARNLFDDFAVTQLYSPTFGTANEPREYGLSLEMAF